MKRSAWVFLLLASLLACKGSKKAEEQKPATASTPAPPPPKAPKEASVEAMKGVCQGKGISDLEPEPRDKATAALFVKKEPTGQLEHVAYEDIVGMKDGIAVHPGRASLVACVEVQKKVKVKSCVMEALDPGKMGGTLNTYKWDYTVTLRETSSGKALSEKKVSRTDDKCPPIHSFKSSTEDLYPPFAVSAGLAVSNHRDGK